MKIDPAPINGIPAVLEVLPKHAEWLKESLPKHYLVLEQMLRDGQAVITDATGDTNA